MSDGRSSKFETRCTLTDLNRPVNRPAKFIGGRGRAGGRWRFNRPAGKPAGLLNLRPGPGRWPASPSPAGRSAGSNPGTLNIDVVWIIRMTRVPSQNI